MPSPFEKSIDKHDIVLIICCFFNYDRQ